MIRRIRWGRVLGVVACAAVAAAAAGYGPGVLRETDAFRVQQVEVVGMRFTDPYELIRAAGLDDEANLFDDADAWRAGIQTHPMVESVRVRRTFPSTVTLEVTESEPVALVAAGTLRPVDARGRLLDLDPAGLVMDLPLLRAPDIRDGRLEGASAAAVATVSVLVRRAPDIAGRVSQIEVEGSAIRLVFRDTRAEAVLPASSGTLELAQLRLALADLGARGELDHVRLIDVRYRDQVVVSFLESPVS